MSATEVLVPPRRTVHSAANAVEASKVYGEGENAVTAVDKVTVAFEQGRFGAIMAPSGSGKSTLMHCMAGLDPLTSGRAFIVDVELNTPSERQLTRLRRDKVGFIFQSYNLVPSLSALENIILPEMLRILEQRQTDGAGVVHWQRLGFVVEVDQQGLAESGLDEAIGMTIEAFNERLAR